MSVQLQSLNSIAEGAKDWRQNLNNDKKSYVRIKKGRNGGLECAISDKHSSHSALKTLKQINQIIGEMNEKATLSPEDQKKLRDIRFLAKGIRDGYQMKYIKTHSNVLDGMRVILGRKSEWEKVEDEANSAIEKLNRLLGHEPGAYQATVDKFWFSEQEAEALNNNIQKAQKRFRSAIKEYFKGVDSGENLDEVAKQLKNNIRTAVEKYNKATNQYTLQQKITAKKALDAIISNIDKEIYSSTSLKNKNEKDFFNGLSLLLTGSTLTHVLRGESAGFRRRYKIDIEKKLKGEEDIVKRREKKYPSQIEQAPSAIIKDVSSAISKGARKLGSLFGK